jgi:hypothetical protein
MEEARQGQTADADRTGALTPDKQLGLRGADMQNERRKRQDLSDWQAGMIVFALAAIVIAFACGMIGSETIFDAADEARRHYLLHELRLLPRPGEP